MPSQLSFMVREKISQMHFAKASGVEIAKALGRSRSTISRELTRNSADGEYFAIQAQRQTESSKENKDRHCV